MAGRSVALDYGPMAQFQGITCCIRFCGNLLICAIALEVNPEG